MTGNFNMRTYRSLKSSTYKGLVWTAVSSFAGFAIVFPSETILIAYKLGGLL